MYGIFEQEFPRYPKTLKGWLRFIKSKIVDLWRKIFGYPPIIFPAIKNSEWGIPIDDLIAEQQFTYSVNQDWWRWVPSEKCFKNEIKSRNIK